jgi:hypothetical protein
MARSRLTSRPSRRPRDVYALRALLYCMLTGSPPYRTDEAVRGIHDAGTLEQRLGSTAECCTTRRGRWPTATCRGSMLPGRDHRPLPVAAAADRYPNVQAVLNAAGPRAKRARRPLLVLRLPRPWCCLSWRRGRLAFDSALRTSRKRDGAGPGSDRSPPSPSPASRPGSDRRWQILERRRLTRCCALASAIPSPARRLAAREELNAQLRGWRRSHWAQQPSPR